MSLLLLLRNLHRIRQHYPTLFSDSFSRILKIKHLELKEVNGQYCYRSHNFNIVPKELESVGRKIKTDTAVG